MEFSCYRRAPGNVQEEIIERVAKAKLAEKK